LGQGDTNIPSHKKGKVKKKRRNTERKGPKRKKK